MSENLDGLEDTPVPFPVSFDSIPVAAILVELDGTILAANPAAGRIYEHDPSALAGSTVHAIAPGFGERWESLLDTVRERGQATHETRFEAPSGWRTVELVLAFITIDGRQLVQAFAMDLSARKTLEHAAREARRLGEDTAREHAEVEERQVAKQRLESLGLVAGGIAHDFNNLLVGVLAEASAAREDRSLADGTREALRRIEAAARRMAQLTRQLLAFSGRGQFVTVAVAADELLGELRDQLARLVRPEVKLELSTGAKGAVVEVDPSLLRQVVVNLVSNASDSGGQRVEVSSRVISRDGSPFWQLEISDDGSGIDSTTFARIFEPFFSSKPGRHGLGLSAVHGIVRRLGGDVQVESRPGKGSQFRVQIPIALGVEPAPRHSTEAIVPLPKLAGVRVLVVDDEPSVRATVRRLLERRGAIVVVASDGTEAEARLRDEQFHLVVSDVSMPGCSGYDVLVTARATQPHVQVVLMSGYTELIRGAGGEEEPDAFIEKPFTAKALDAAIDEVLRGKTSAP
jgi:PAS domain S-box-containing protein